MGTNQVKDGIGLDSVLSLIWFCNSVCLYIWNFSIVSINLPFLVVCSISMISVIGPMECLWSSMCVASTVRCNPAMNTYSVDLLTPRSRVLFEKLTGIQLVKKFPAFYRTRRFITAFTCAPPPPSVRILRQLDLPSMNIYKIFKVNEM
jgi:hypothetical protein